MLTIFDLNRGKLAAKILRPVYFLDNKSKRFKGIQIHRTIKETQAKVYSMFYLIFLDSNFAARGLTSYGQTNFQIWLNSNVSDNLRVRS